MRANRFKIWLSSPTLACPFLNFAIRHTRISKAQRSQFVSTPGGETVVLGTYDFKAQRPTISLVSLDSGQVLRTFEYDSRHQGQPRFSPDGKGIVYPVREKGLDNLWLQPLDGGPGRQLTNFGSLKIYSYQWSPDGKSLALVRGDSPSDLVLIQNSPGK